MRSRRPSSSTDDEDSDAASPVDGGDPTVGQLLSLPPELPSKLGDLNCIKLATSKSTTLPQVSQLPLTTTNSLSEKAKSDISTHIGKDKMEEPRNYRRPKSRNFWACSISTLCVTILSAVVMVAIVHSFQKKQCDAKGCIKTYMSPAYAPLVNFDQEHTRFASKYKVYLYRERQYDTSSLDVCWKNWHLPPWKPEIWMLMSGLILCFSSPREFQYCSFPGMQEATSRSGQWQRKVHGNGLSW